MHDNKKLNLPVWRQGVCFIAFVCLYFATAMTTVRAQQLDTVLPPPDPRYLAALADTCRPLAVLENTVVQFNGYARAYFRVSGATTNPMLYYRVGSTGVFAQSQLQSSGSLLLTQLAPNSQYEVWAADNCGNLTKIAAINTQVGEQQEVSVSEPFFDAMVQHAKKGMASMPFWDYLKQQDNVSDYEKLAYAQQFYLKGAPIGFDDPDDFSPPQLDSCRCQWYLNPTQSVSLGTQVPNVPDDHAGTIIEHNNTLPLDEVDTYAAYWGLNNNKGPAKYHQLWMEGFKATKDRLQEKSWSHFGTNTANSTQFARLRVNLHCAGNQDPEACQCRKTYRFYYRYDTEVAAHTHLVSGGTGDKKGFAAVEDAAVVTFRNEVTDVRELIAAGKAGAKAECERLVNDDFWLNWIEFARVVANVLLDTNSIDTSDINQLANVLANLVTTNYYEAANCGTADTVATLFDGHKDRSLFANQPIEVKLYSFDNLLAGGMRSWHSWARANSDFYLMGYIPGGNLQGESSRCCMAQFAHWVLGSIDGPLSTSDLKEEVGEDMYSYYPWDLPINSGQGLVMLPGEYGWTSKSVPQDCHYVVIGGDERSSETDAIAPPMLLGNGTIRVFDTAGRLLLSRDYQEVGTDVQSFLRGVGLHDLPGLYFLQISDGTSTKGYKMLLK